MRTEKTIYTQPTTTSTPLHVDPEIIQEFYDKMTEFFETTSLSTSVKFLNRVFIDCLWDKHTGDEVLKRSTSRITDDKSITEVISEAKKLQEHLSEAGMFAWESNRFIEFLVEIHDMLIILTEAGMTSTAHKSLEALHNKSQVQ